MMDLISPNTKQFMGGQLQIAQIARRGVHTPVQDHQWILRIVEHRANGSEPPSTPYVCLPMGSKAGEPYSTEKSYTVQCYYCIIEFKDYTWIDSLGPMSQCPNSGQSLHFLFRTLSTVIMLQTTAARARSAFPWHCRLIVRVLRCSSMSSRFPYFILVPPDRPGDFDGPTTLNYWNPIDIVAAFSHYWASTVTANDKDGCSLFGAVIESQINESTDARNK